MSFAMVAAGYVALQAYSMDKARSANNKANDLAVQNAKTTALNADEANNRANAKAPDTAAAMSAAVMSGKAGQSGTMLTGPSGVDPTQLTLGKSTLLGG